MIRTPLPQQFVDIHEAQFLAALDSAPVTSIRLNPLKKFDCRYRDAVLWCAEGRYLPERVVFTLDPRFAAGAYYVQEASSMFLEFVVNNIDLPQSPLILDLCAAPGGKSTHLQALAGSRGVVVSNEIIRQRAGVLAQNVVKWGAGNGIVCSADAAVFGSSLPSAFDVLVVDAPCSGEGMFRKDDTARAQWSMQGVEHCAARARRILSDSWDALRVGGYLIFSTCTFNRTENEDNVAWAAAELGGEVVEFDNLPQGVVKSEAGYRFSPDRVRGEGFFIAVIRKTSPAPAERRAKFDSRNIKIANQYTTLPLLQIERAQTTYGYSEPLFKMVEHLRSAHVQMLTAGVEIGQMIRGELKPAHGLALYCNICRNKFVSTELSKQDALEYLRKGVLSADLLVPGLQLITYEALSLGFARRIDRRVNNLYPTSWRILLSL